MIYTVHPDKISKYLLDVLSKRSGPKAQFFLSRGFLVEQPEALAEALRRHAVEAALRTELWTQRVFGWCSSARWLRLTARDRVSEASGSKLPTHPHAA